MTVEGMTCNAVYGLFSWNADDTNNEGKAKRVNNPNEYKNMNSAVAEGKYERTDANVIQNVEARNLTLENGRIGRDGTLQGRSNVGITSSCDVEGLDKGEEDSSLSLEQL
jgi:beta-mannanase